MDLREKGAKGIFDGEAAQKGYRLNAMCYSLNHSENRAAFLEDEAAYCRKWGLNDEQTEAILSRDKSKFTFAGGSLYYFGKFIRLYPGAGGNFDYSSKVGEKAGA